MARMSLQPGLFAADEVPLRVQAATPDAHAVALAQALRERYRGRCHLGTSSWHFPGWAGQVWSLEDA